MIGGAKRPFFVHPPTTTTTAPPDRHKHAGITRSALRKSTRSERTEIQTASCPPLLPLLTAGYIKPLRVRLIRDYEAVSWGCNFSGTLLLEPHTPLFASQWNSPDPFAAAEGAGGTGADAAGQSPPGRKTVGIAVNRAQPSCYRPVETNPFFSATSLKMRCRIKQEVPRAAGHTPPRGATCLPHHIRKSF